jgi:hypothetical protein
MSCSIFSSSTIPNSAWSPAVLLSWCYFYPFYRLVVFACVRFLDGMIGTGNHGFEGLFDVVAFEGTGLHEHHAVLAGILFPVFV